MNMSNFWNLIEKNAGRVFYTISGLEFTYTFHGDYIIVSRAKTTKLYKTVFEKALNMHYSSYKELGNAGIRGHNYIYVIIETLKGETNFLDSQKKREEKPAREEGFRTVEVVPIKTQIETKQKVSFGKQLLAVFASYLSHTKVYSITTIGRDSHGRLHSRSRYKIVHRII